MKSLRICHRYWQFKVVVPVHGYNFPFQTLSCVVFRTEYNNYLEKDLYRIDLTRNKLYNYLSFLGKYLPIRCFFYNLMLPHEVSFRKR